MLKNFVELDLWGASVLVEEVPSNNPKDLQMPLTDVVRFRFFQRTVTTINSEELKGSKKNFSHWYYVGKRLKISDVKKLYPESKDLMARMKKSNCDAVLVRGEALILLASGDSVFNKN